MGPPTRRVASGVSRRYKTCQSLGIAALEARGARPAPTLGSRAAGDPRRAVRMPASALFPNNRTRRRCHRAPGQSGLDTRKKRPAKGALMSSRTSQAPRWPRWCARLWRRGARPGPPPPPLLRRVRISSFCNGRGRSVTSSPRSGRALQAHRGSRAGLARAARLGRPIPECHSFYIRSSFRLWLGGLPSLLRGDHRETANVQSAGDGAWGR